MTARLSVFLIAATALADQLSKAAALSELALGEPIAVVPGFNLTLGFNEGSSFGMLSGVMAGKPLLMAALTSILTLVFAVMAFRARHPLERVGFALVVGGAHGNIIDRLRLGAVTDFLDLYWRDWHWPTFNVADSRRPLDADGPVLQRHRTHSAPVPVRTPALRRTHGPPRRTSRNIGGNQ